MSEWSVIKFYDVETGELLARTRDAISVPRQGEYVSIEKETWFVERVTWALDAGPNERSLVLRANVEMSPHKERS
ncbi:MAG: hypothetical protein AAFX52_10985 [Pseudomonadota bacterium]